MSSAITSLPAELVALVFTLALNVPHPLDAEGRASFKTLRDVCSRWREISLKTPELWKSLDINVGTTPVSSVESWFRRGGKDSHPSLVVRVRPCEQPAVPNGLTFDSLKALLESYQWSRLDLHDLGEVEEMMGIVEVYKSCRSSYPTLRMFAIQGEPATRESGLQVTISKFPQLQDLFVGYHFRTCIPMYIPYDFGRLVINHANLTSLHLDYLTASEEMTTVAFSQLVSEDNLPSLQELIVCWYAQPLHLDDDPPGDPSPIRRNSSIRKLILVGYCCIDALQHVVFPSLHLLRMVFMRLLHRQPLEHLRGFLQRCAPPTLSMESAGLYVYPLDIAIGPEVCKMAAHRIRELNIRSADWICEMDAANRDIFPCLQRITVMRSLPPLPSHLHRYLENNKDVPMLASSVSLIISVPHSPTNSKYMSLLEPEGPLVLEVRRESEDELPVLSYDIKAHLYHEDPTTAHPLSRLYSRYTPGA